MAEVIEKMAELEMALFLDISGQEFILTMSGKASFGFNNSLYYTS